MDRRIEYFLEQVEILKEKLSIDIIRDGKSVIFIDSKDNKVLEVHYPCWTDKTFYNTNIKLSEIRKEE